MELKYIWIKEFKNIHKQGFSFTDQYLINYNFEVGELVIENNSSHIPNFFGGNIKAVTGIIGENGVGKSNLLEFINLRLTTFHEGTWTLFQNNSLPGIFIFDKTIYIHNTLPLENEEELLRREFVINYYNQSVGRILPNRHADEEEIGRAAVELFSNKYIYFSNIFDLQHHYDNDSIDISTNSLVYNDVRSGRYVDAYNTDKPVNYLYYFKMEEIRRQLNYLSTSERELPFNLPKSLTIEIADKENNYLNIPYEWFEENDLVELHRIFGFFFPEINYAKVDEETYKTQVKRHFKFKALLIFAKKSTEKVKEIKHQYYSIIDGALSEQETYILERDEDFVKLIITIKLFDQIVDRSRMPSLYSFESTKITLWELINTVIFPIDKINLNDLYEFLNKYEELVDGKGFLNYYWMGFSSGQLNMLIIFSRFYAALEHPLLEAENHVTILMDEGETYFHPTWQKSFLLMLLDYFKETFINNSVHLILTSNSPFIASDIPKSMINFLRRDQEGNCIVVNELSQDQETFASNIHTLYADGFFMGNSLMGNFAEKTINQIIRIINGEETFNSQISNWEAVQSYINLIGEPVLRMLVQNQFNNRVR